jgi:Fuc2NAc and GlcNAc transferase
LIPSLIIAGCALLSAFLVRAIRDFANGRELLDQPNERSSHATPKPRMGGIGVIIPVLAVGAGLVATGLAPIDLLIPLAATGLISILGLIDDLRSLSARIRFGAQVVLASGVVAASWSRLPSAADLSGGWLSTPVVAALAVLWIVWLANLYNFMDGIDGIAGVQAAIASLGLAAVAAGLGAGTTTWLLLALAGSSVGFLFFNYPPSSIFMGDVGSTAIGFFFGILPLLPEARSVPLEPVAIALFFFLLDATLTLARRVVTGEKWYTPHRTHLYQRPVVMGVGHRSVLLVAAGAMVLASGFAVRWLDASRMRRAAMLAMLIALYAAGQGAVGWFERRVDRGA